MLTEIVTRALTHLNGSPMPQAQMKRNFRYAYASDDGHYVAILAHDFTTYIVDLETARYHAEPGGVPRGFAGHVLEMEGAAPAAEAAALGLAQFDLDMNAEEIRWRQCPRDRAAQDDGAPGRLYS